MLWFVKCRNTENKSPNLTFSRLPKIKKNRQNVKNRINCTDLSKVMSMWEEHREESCFNKAADLGRELMNTKD